MKLLVLFALMPLLFCQNNPNKSANLIVAENKSVFIFDSSASFIAKRYLCPDSFARTSLDTNSFAFYLSHLPLKPMGSLVRNFDGSYKNDYAYSSVVDMEISPRDLQQCADAVMRLRGEYLYSTKQYGKISFRFLGDGLMHSYKDYSGEDRSYKKFRKYMDFVFTYANTASLIKQLKAIPFSSMQIGDVLIQKGNPYGHAVIVVDMCVNSKGEKLFLLAQSYMPAQETQILKNPSSQFSWYSKPIGSAIQTPEWTFDTADLHRW
ncbi:MAG: hypothetical protein IT245_02135 [Bacteroidia bacterium]|nr:hypothetical protein [Bacteroidia bacterium]